MGFLFNVVRRTVVLSLALFYGTIVCLRLALATVLKPSKQFWYSKQRDTPPKCLTDPALGTHKYLQLKDVKLHYVEKGDNTKPLVLFVHGFPEFWYSWRHQMKEFSKDYWTVALDMRGYGDSDKPVGVGNYRLSFLVNDLKEFVEGLGSKKVILVAHDWGGIVAWSFLYNYPEMVDKFVIMGSAHPRLFMKHMLSHWKQFRMSWYMFFFQLPYLPEIFIKSYDMVSLRRMLKGSSSKDSVTDEDIEAFKYTFGKPGALTAPINYYRASLMTHRLKKIEDDLPPGMLISGEKDFFISLELMEITKKENPHLRIEIVKDANHFVQQDEPDAVNNLLRTFLKN